MSNIMENNGEIKLTRTLIAGVDCGEYDIDNSMSELESLCEAGELQVVCQVVQKKDNPEKKYYFGEDKGPLQLQRCGACGGGHRAYRQPDKEYFRLS